MELRGSKLLVTGASTGIGAELAVALGRAGATLGLVARREELLDEVLERARGAGAGSGSRRFATDLGDLQAAERVAIDAWDTLGGLDGFVSNAAIPKRKRLSGLRADEMEAVMHVNFLAPVRMTPALLPRMRERRSGCIVMVGSITGRIPVPGESAYVASTYALAGFTETLACELAGSGVRAHLMTLGPFDTPIWSVPDNDPSPFEVPKNPPSLAADAIVQVLTAEGPFEIDCPGGHRAHREVEGSRSRGLHPPGERRRPATGGHPRRSERAALVSAESRCEEPPRRAAQQFGCAAEHASLVGSCVPVGAQRVGVATRHCDGLAHDLRRASGAAS